MSQVLEMRCTSVVLTRTDGKTCTATFREVGKLNPQQSSTLVLQCPKEGEDYQVGKNYLVEVQS